MAAGRSEARAAKSAQQSRVRAHIKRFKRLGRIFAHQWMGPNASGGLPDSLKRVTCFVRLCVISRCTCMEALAGVLPTCQVNVAGVPLRLSNSGLNYVLIGLVPRHLNVQLQRRLLYASLGTLSGLRVLCLLLSVLSAFPDTRVSTYSVSCAMTFLCHLI
jgi:hypothetical protein